MWETQSAHTKKTQKRKKKLPQPIKQTTPGLVRLLWPLPRKRPAGAILTAAQPSWGLQKLQDNQLTTKPDTLHMYNTVVSQ